MNTSFIPYNRPSIGEEEIAEVVDTLRSGWLTSGPKTEQFEREFATYVGAPHALAVNSCTAGLHLALAALGLGPGDEVITTPLTFCATVNTIMHVGATPVLADIGEDGNIDPESIRRYLTNRTRAILPVHLAGTLGRLRRAQDKFARASGRMPTVDELSALTGVPPEQIARALDVVAQPISLDAPVASGEGRLFGGFLAGTRQFRMTQAFALRHNCRPDKFCSTEHGKLSLEDFLGQPGVGKRILDHIVESPKQRPIQHLRVVRCRHHQTVGGVLFEQL